VANVCHPILLVIPARSDAEFGQQIFTELKRVFTYKFVSLASLHHV